jgi:prepilin-type N-terminal cleavage/methylation domain-containing protein
MIKRLQERRDEGFTLIELLIVIIILGILATVVIFAVGGIRDRGQENACKTEKKNIETALEAYLSDNDVDTYPTALASLASLKNPGTLASRWALVTTSGGSTAYTVSSSQAPFLDGLLKCNTFGDGGA